MKAVSNSKEECESWFENNSAPGIAANIYMLYCDSAVSILCIRNHSGDTCVMSYATIGDFNARVRWHCGSGS